MTATPWLSLALSERGTAEVPGPGSNPKVLAYFADIGWLDVTDDATAWCAAAVGSWLKRSGMPTPPPNVALLARSYLTYGVACDPQPGAIGIWPRGKADWQGHVGLLVSVDHQARTCQLVAGNQGNAVSIQTYRLDTALAFRWPVALTVGALRRAGSTEIKAADRLELAGVGGAAVAVGGAAAAEAFKMPTPVDPAPEPVIDPAALTLLEQLTAAGKAIGGLFAQHPWLVGCVVGCLAAFIVARTIKRRRLARAQLGASLSAEVV